MYAIYARQSVDRPDSISIESQIEFCMHEVRGESYKVYEDKGYSGKNTDRPMFQMLISEIKKGNIKKVVVYKLDRISRSILDFSNMMCLFQQYNVEFVSSTEKFDTSTPMGRAMLNICIVFAQLERETIQKRVTDAYISRSQKGFYMGGRVPYGFTLADTVINGVKTSMYVVNPEEAEHIRIIYDIYQEPTASYGDIINYFKAHNILWRGRKCHISRISQALRNPVYVKSDTDIYDFFKSQGAIIVNDRADFIGLNGCYYYQSQDTETKRTLKDNVLVLAPHEGFIPSDIWLKCRIRCLHNSQIQTGRKVSNTWLAGKLKCGHCGYALVKKNVPGKSYSYYRCSHQTATRDCTGIGYIRAEELEEIILLKITEKLSEFSQLSAKGNDRLNPKLTALQVKLEAVEKEIGNLLSGIDFANKVLLSYINGKITELDAQKQKVMEEIAKASADIVDTGQILQIGDLIRNWDSISMDDKRQICDSLIQVIHVTPEKTKISWKF